LLLIAAIGAKSQTQVTSKAKGDKIWLMPGCGEIYPIPIGIGKDTIRSMGYSMTFGRDTTGTAVILINGYNKYGSIVLTQSQTIAMSAYRHWGMLISPIDTYISSVYPSVVKQ